MCVGKITNPDVLADCFDAFYSDEDAPDPIEVEHHAILECFAYASTGQMISDLFLSHVSTVSQFLNQPDCNRLAKFLTWIRMLRLNTAQSDGFARPRTDLKSINNSINYTHRLFKGCSSCLLFPLGVCKALSKPKINSGNPRSKPGRAIY